MFKRIRWFALGAIFGSLTTVYGLFRLRRSRQRYTSPEQVVDSVGSALHNVGTTVRDAWDESKDAIREAEAELRDDYVGKRPRLRLRVAQAGVAGGRG